MRKSMFLIVFLLFLSQFLLAETIIQSYNFDKPEIKTENGYDEIVYENCHNFGEEGYPSLPYLSADILIPQNQELEEVRIISSEYYPVQNGITIKPAERQFPLSSGKHLDYKVIPNEEIYNSTESFPGKTINNTNTHFLCGHSIASFTICPVNYFPAENQVELLKSITIEIKTGTTRKVLSAEKFLKNSLKIEKRIHNIVDNPEMLNQYSYSHQSRDSEEDILLITNNALLPSFSDYIAFKEETGFIVATVTTEYIDTNYTGADLQEKIRNCIIDHYTNNSISYVILGGDSSPVTPSDNIIPHRGFWDDAYGENEDDIPADVYYSNLDGNWNTDGDSRWGEPGEDDLYSEVGIGRICVDTATEILNFTNKLEMYQNSPVVADIEKALMLGELLWDDPTWGGDYKDEVADGSSMHGYTTAGVSANFTTTRLYERDTSYNKYDIFSQFNTTGINLLNHLGHSNVDYNMLMYNSDLTTSNFTNNGVSRGYVIGYSQGCYNGSFDNRNSYGSYSGTNCFAEQITTIATAEVASIGNSRYGWGMHSSTNGGSQYFDRQFYDAIFGEDITIIGTANADSKEDNIGYINNDPIRWCYYELTLFGDPSMDIWTDAPVAMNVSYSASVSIGTSSIDFTTDAPYARIGLMQNGAMIGRSVADAIGDVTVNLFSAIDNTNDISVSIIGHNKIRHQGTILIVSNQAYLIIESYTVDAGGDDVIEPGETVTLTVTLENVGDQDAHSVNMTLSETDPYITLTDSYESYGTIVASGTVTRTNAYTFDVSSSIPDNHPIQLDAEIVATEGTWNDDINLTATNPVDITYSPSSFSETLEPDQNSSQNLYVGNSGGATLDYTATVQNSRRVSDSPSKQKKKAINELNNIPVEKPYLEPFVDMSHLYTSRAYCASTYSNTDDDWITNVTFNTIDNDTGSEGAGSYGDYTFISTDVVQGSIYNLSVTFYSEGLWTEYVKVWIDWDQDDVFAESESYQLGSGVDATLNMDIEIPMSAVLGSTRMRVVERYNEYPGPCDNATYGEVEDYSVNVVSSGPEWLTLDGGHIVSSSIPQGNPDDTILVGFDSTDLTEGIYTANIVIESNDSDESPVTIPVTFTVDTNPVPEITVTSPNGGEDWELDTTHNITWTSSNTSGNVKIELYDNGSFYNTIISSTTDDGTYSWNIPDTYAAGTQYTIKIEDVTDPATYDFSDADFTLSSPPPPVITVTSPNGGEDWELDSTHNITWTSSNTSGNVKIELYDNGSFYNTIISSTTDDNSYSWDIPLGWDAGTQYTIKIEDVTDPATYDFSDNDFSLSNPTTSTTITITTPNGGEEWDPGSIYDIEWTTDYARSSNPVSSNELIFKFDLLIDDVINSDETRDGRPNPSVVAGSVEYVSGGIPEIADFSYTAWFLNDPTDTIDQDSPSSNYYYDTPGYEGAFMMNCQDFVDWEVGETFHIEFNCAGYGAVREFVHAGAGVYYLEPYPEPTLLERVQIELYKDDSFYATISSNEPNLGTYEWSIPGSYLSGNDYQVKITMLHNSLINDFSDTYFTLTGLDAPIVTISEDGTNVTLNWNEVSGATSYTVYSDADPYGSFTFDEWTGTGTTWNESLTEEMKFYRVTTGN